MEILEITQKVIDGKVVVEVPGLYNNQDVRIVVSKDNEDNEDWANLSANKRIEILQQFYGEDKFPYVKVGKYDVYNQ